MLFRCPIICLIPSVIYSQTKEFLTLVWVEPGELPRVRLELWLTVFAFFIINATITQKFWKGSFRKLRSAQFSTWKITFALYTSRKLWQRRHWQWKILPGNWRPNDGADAMQSVNVIGGNNYPRNCKEIRDRFCDFFSATGKVPWPDKFI